LYKIKVKPTRLYAWYFTILFVFLQAFGSPIIESYHKIKKNQPYKAGSESAGSGIGSGSDSGNSGSTGSSCGSSRTGSGSS
jgi:hypothetical protein